MENQMIEINGIAKELKNRSDIRAKNIYNLLNWKTIEEFPMYSVSKQGQIRNDKTGLILKNIVANTGYYVIHLFNDDVKKICTVHRLVAKAFLENTNNKLCVDHIDRNRQNNDVLNLKWSSYTENNNNKTKAIKSGVTGVTYVTSINKWRSRIVVNGKDKCLGFFDKKEDAITARKNIVSL